MDLEGGLHRRGAWSHRHRPLPDLEVLPLRENRGGAVAPHRKCLLRYSGEVRNRGTSAATARSWRSRTAMPTRGRADVPDRVIVTSGLPVPEDRLITRVEQPPSTRGRPRLFSTTHRCPPEHSPRSLLEASVATFQSSMRQAARSGSARKGRIRLGDGAYSRSFGRNLSATASPPMPPAARWQARTTR